MAGAICLLCSLPHGQLYHCAYASWYNNRKAVIIFQVAFASPPLALPAVATGEVANYTTVRVALCGIITAKQLLYFKMAGAICSLCSLPHGQLYHFTRCVHGIITTKSLLYFNAPSAVIIFVVLQKS